ncbi:hypothetical protein KIH74_14760 [Kineosporia sp. J2-2]|uniref:NACHT domain-containing protein n=1 Tax=Kineosporia corallincola TaxID=2835133 RepID=A0ABS5TKT4_9ACTN|nr:FtsK/SpoIIIE domain-containing protein [Kineosporia corallincola]MBT0770199.1 hypothetical protein [Kineosporia corallincola]
MLADGEPLGLDRLLPPLLPTREHGLRAVPAPGSPPLPRLHVPVGVAAEPAHGLCLADLGGHTLVLGQAGSGRGSTLGTLVAGLALTHSPETVQVYCLTGGADGEDPVADLAALPHVGAVVDASDRAAAIALLQHLGRRPDQDVDVYLVADCPSHLAALGPELVATADAAPGREVHLLLAADSLEQVPAPLRTWFTTRVELDVEPDVKLDVEPGAGPGRAGSGRVIGLDGKARAFTGVVTRIGVEAPGTGPGDARRHLAAEVARHWAPRPPAPEVAGLSSSTSPKDRPGTSTALRVRLGLDGPDGRPMTHDFGRHRALIVRGPAGSGKTALLRDLATELVRDRTPAQVRILLVDYRAGLIDAVDEKYLLGHAFHPGALQDLIDGTLWALAGRGGDAAWRGPRLYVLVDDHVHAANDEDIWAPVLRHLEADHDAGVHLVLAEAAGQPDVTQDDEISSITLSQALGEIGAAVVDLGQ